MYRKCCQGFRQVLLLLPLVSCCLARFLLLRLGGCPTKCWFRCYLQFWRFLSWFICAGQESYVVVLWEIKKSALTLPEPALTGYPQKSIHYSWRSYDVGTVCHQDGFSYSYPEPLHLYHGRLWSVYRVLYKEDWVWLVTLIFNVWWFCHQDWACVWGKVWRTCHCQEGHIGVTLSCTH